MKYFLSLSLLFLFSITSYTLDASYDIGEELILIERHPIAGKTYGKHDYPLTTPAFSIYYNPITTNYYFVEDGAGMTKTNGLRYKLDPKKVEKTYTKENLDPFLTYVGYISTNQRLYIDKRNNDQYIKVLEPILDDQVLVIRAQPSKDSDSYRISYTEPGDNRGASRYYYKRGVINMDEVLRNAYP